MARTFRHPDRRARPPVNGFRLTLAALSFLTLTWAGSAVPSSLAAQTRELKEPKTARFETIATSVRALDERDDPSATLYRVEDRLAANRVPGVAMAIIEDGAVAFVGGYGSRKASDGEPVDGDTVFSAGSISKLVNAALVLRLVQDGTLNLDADITTYLKRWAPPESRRARGAKITLRQILSHTSGFSQGGFPDFQPDEPVPTLLQTLNGERPAKHKAIRIRSRPGERMSYSGGGTTVAQMIVEDATGLSYEEAARTWVFEPLSMERSTFVSPLPEDYGNIAYAHDEDGDATALPRGYETFPEQAASGLWTSANDLARFILAFTSDEAFLREELRVLVTSRAENSWHGLGPRINGEGQGLVVHHGGSNQSYQSWVEFHPGTGDGFVALTNGANGRRLAYELRIAAQDQLGWSIRFPDAFSTPEL